MKQEHKWRSNEFMDILNKRPYSERYLKGTETPPGGKVTPPPKKKKLSVCNFSI